MILYLREQLFPHFGWRALSHIGFVHKVILYLQEQLFPICYHGDPHFGKKATAFTSHCGVGPQQLMSSEYKPFFSGAREFLNLLYSLKMREVRKQTGERNLNMLGEILGKLKCKELHTCPWFCVPQGSQTDDQGESVTVAPEPQLFSPWGFTISPHYPIRHMTLFMNFSSQFHLPHNAATSENVEPFYFSLRNHAQDVGSGLRCDIVYSKLN